MAADAVLAGGDAASATVGEAVRETRIGKAINTLDFFITNLR
jgi:hypothetical protein